MILFIYLFKCHSPFINHHYQMFYGCVNILVFLMYKLLLARNVKMKRMVYIGYSISAV